jgi:hypothetical protein
METYRNIVTLTGNIVVDVEVLYELDNGKPENMEIYQVFSDGTQDEISPSQQDVDLIADDIIRSIHL